MDKNIIKSNKLVNDIEKVTEDLDIEDLLDLIDDIEINLDEFELEDDIAYEILREADRIFFGLED